MTGPYTDIRDREGEAQRQFMNRALGASFLLGVVVGLGIGIAIGMMYAFSLVESLTN